MFFTTVYTIYYYLFGFCFDFCFYFLCVNWFWFDNFRFNFYSNCKFSFYIAIAFSISIPTPNRTIFYTFWYRYIISTYIVFELSTTLCKSIRYRDSRRDIKFFLFYYIFFIKLMKCINNIYYTAYRFFKII